jgi:hypothetical protein
LKNIICSQTLFYDAGVLLMLSVNELALEIFEHLAETPEEFNCS